MDFLNHDDKIIKSLQWNENWVFGLDVTIYNTVTDASEPSQDESILLIVSERGSGEECARFWVYRPDKEHFQIAISGAGFSNLTTPFPCDTPLRITFVYQAQHRDHGLYYFCEGQTRMWVEVILEDDEDRPRRHDTLVGSWPIRSRYPPRPASLSLSNKLVQPPEWSADLGLLWHKLSTFYGVPLLLSSIIALGDIDLNDPIFNSKWLG